VIKGLQPIGKGGGGAARAYTSPDPASLAASVSKQRF